MKLLFNLIALLLLLFYSAKGVSQEQSISGLWGIEKVAVGDESMTPIAKWFRINPDGSYQSGNGWLQNGQGLWSYDADSKVYTAKDDLDVGDEYGGFTVSFDDQKMKWEREEDGMVVTVTLIRIDELPMSPADYLEGIWEPNDTTSSSKLFIRWDRVYIHFGGDGEKRTGYWHIHGHKPHVTLLPHQDDANPESWKVEVNDKALIMRGISESNRDLERTYTRKFSF